MRNMTDQRSPGWTRLLWFGTVMMGLYYIADSSMDALLFDEGTVFEQVFTPDSHELAIRILSGTFYFAFFLYARHLFIKNQRLQQHLLTKSQELMEANLQCEIFTHTFSNEIKSNISSIYSAEQLLAENNNHQLSRDNQELIGKIRMSCVKITTLLDKALDLSQVLRARLDFQKVSLNLLVQEVSSAVISEVKNITVSIETEKNLELECDPNLMRMAIKNLCLNAVNLNRSNKQANISIGAENRNGERIYFVRREDLAGSPDNRQTGFEPEGCLSQAKEPFDDSTGLTSVKTIIERHGGKIWTENTPGLGSAYCFTL